MNDFQLANVSLSANSIDDETLLGLFVSSVTWPLLGYYFIECCYINWSSCCLFLLWGSGSDKRSKMWSAGAVKGHRKRLRGRMTNDTCIRCIVMIFWGVNCLGSLCHWRFFISNVIGERKKLKAQVELLQLRSPPNPKKKENTVTKARCKHKRGSIAYILNFLPWKNINH